MGQQIVAPRYSLLVTLLIYSCTFSTQAEDVVIQNQADGCFELSKSSLVERGESVWISATVAAAKPDSDCPCKSALFSYSAFQKRDQQIIKILSAQFTMMTKASIELPVAAQKQLLFPDQPVYLDITCGP